MTAVTASVLTSETRTSSSYGNLTTTTDSVTATVGASGTVLVCMSADITVNNSNGGGYVSYDVSGANTISADDTKRIAVGYLAYGSINFGLFILETGLSPGSTTFKMKYRGTGLGPSVTCANRYITVIPLEDLTTRTAAAAYTAPTFTESTTSSTYGDLTTTTDTVTVTIGPSGKALVFTSSNLSAGSSTSTAFCSYAVSGATTRSADDAHAISSEGAVGKTHGGCFLETGLGAGSTTFKMKYKSGDNSSTKSFDDRRIAVIPL